MIVRIRPEWFSLETVKKLHACSVDQFQILKKLTDSTYIIDLPNNFGISSTLNVEDLVDYKGLNFSPNNSMVNEPDPEHISESPFTSSTPIYFTQHSKWDW